MYGNSVLEIAWLQPSDALWLWSLPFSFGGIRNPGRRSAGIILIQQLPRQEKPQWPSRQVAHLLRRLQSSAMPQGIRFTSPPQAGLHFTHTLQSNQGISCVDSFVHSSM